MLTRLVSTMASRIGLGLGLQRKLVFAVPGCETVAQNLGEPSSLPASSIARSGGTEVIIDGRFQYVPSTYANFTDGTPNIELGGFTPKNIVRGRDIVFFASFHTPESTMYSFHSLIVLLQSHIKSMTIVAPFFPFATMERVSKEGVVATANTTAVLLNNLPSCGAPTELVLFDLHTLQNRFFFHGFMCPTLLSGIPLLRSHPVTREITYVFFPDEGAKKRFSTMFPGLKTGHCEKVRRGEERVIRVVDPEGYEFRGATILLVDDLVRTGGTLRNSAAALKGLGASKIVAYCTHAAGTVEELMTFSKTSPTAWLSTSLSQDTETGDTGEEGATGEMGAAGEVGVTGGEGTTGGKRPLCIDTLLLTDSVPQTVAELPEGDVFAILPLHSLLRAHLFPPIRSE